MLWEQGSEVQIGSPRPFKAMGYGLGRSPFLLWLALGLAFGMAWVMVCQFRRFARPAPFVAYKGNIFFALPTGKMKITPLHFKFIPTL